MLHAGPARRWHLRRDRYGRSVALVQFASLAATTGGDLASAVQFPLVGVLVGGQLAPFLASRGAFTDEQIERFALRSLPWWGLVFAAKAVLG